MNKAVQRVQAVAQDSGTAVARSFAAAGLDWIVPEWAAPANVMAFTTTRHHDAQSPDEDSPADRKQARGEGAIVLDAERATVERDRLSIFLPASPAWLKQVHGADVVVLDEQSLVAARKTPLVADAAVTRLQGIVCAVATADCLPVLFADRHGQVVGAAHAGWRGLASGVLEATVRSLRTLGADPDDLVAWLGPAIGPSAFEVGADVFAAFCDDDAHAQRHFKRHREDKWHADLYALARLRLVRSGVRDVTGGGWCTFSDATRFHSYRRERATGRMVTAVWLAPGVYPSPDSR